MIIEDRETSGDAGLPIQRDGVLQEVQRDGSRLYN